MRAAIFVILVVLSMALALSAQSHHSFSAEFDIARPVSLTGTVSRIEWTNPHAWIYIDVDDGSGSTQSWGIELLGINTLMRRGLTRTSIAPGDVLTIEGFGARNGTNSANASTVKATDSGDVLWASAAGDRRD